MAKKSKAKSVKVAGHIRGKVKGGKQKVAAKVGNMPAAQFKGGKRKISSTSPGVSRAPKKVVGNPGENYMSGGRRTSFKG